jgi:hypothetical protein
VALAFYDCSGGFTGDSPGEPVSPGARRLPQ